MSRRMPRPPLRARGLAVGLLPAAGFTFVVDHTVAVLSGGRRINDGDQPRPSPQQPLSPEEREDARRAAEVETRVSFLQHQRSDTGETSPGVEGDESSQPTAATNSLESSRASRGLRLGRAGGGAVSVASSPQYVVGAANSNPDDAATEVVESQAHGGQTRTQAAARKSSKRRIKSGLLFRSGLDDIDMESTSMTEQRIMRMDESENINMAGQFWRHESGHQGPTQANAAGQQAAPAAQNNGHPLQRSPGQKNLAVIVLAAVGGVLAVVAVFVIACCCCKKRKNRASAKNFFGTTAAGKKAQERTATRGGDRERPAEEADVAALMRQLGATNDYACAFAVMAADPNFANEETVPAADAAPTKKALQKLGLLDPKTKQMKTLGDARRAVKKQGCEETVREDVRLLIDIVDMAPSVAELVGESIANPANRPNDEIPAKVLTHLKLFGFEQGDSFGMAREAVQELHGKQQELADLPSQMVSTSPGRKSQVARAKKMKKRTKGGTTGLKGTMKKVNGFEEVFAATEMDSQMAKDFKTVMRKKKLVKGGTAKGRKSEIGGPRKSIIGGGRKSQMPSAFDYGMEEDYSGMGSSGSEGRKSRRGGGKSGRKSARSGMASTYGDSGKKKKKIPLSPEEKEWKALVTFNPEAHKIFKKLTRRKISDDGAKRIAKQLCDPQAIDVQKFDDSLLNNPDRKTLAEMCGVQQGARLLIRDVREALGSGGGGASGVVSGRSSMALTSMLPSTAPGSRRASQAMASQAAPSSIVGGLSSMMPRSAMEGPAGAMSGSTDGGSTRFQKHAMNLVTNKADLDEVESAGRGNVVGGPSALDIAAILVGQGFTEDYAVELATQMNDAKTQDEDRIFPASANMDLAILKAFEMSNDTHVAVMRGFVAGRGWGGCRLLGEDNQKWCHRDDVETLFEPFSPKVRKKMVGQVLDEGKRPSDPVDLKDATPHDLEEFKNFFDPDEQNEGKGGPNTPIKDLRNKVTDKLKDKKKKWTAKDLDDIVNPRKPGNENRPRNFDDVPGGRPPGGGGGNKNGGGGGPGGPNDGRGGGGPGGPNGGRGGGGGGPGGPNDGRGGGGPGGPNGGRGGGGGGPGGPNDGRGGGGPGGPNDGRGGGPGGPNDGRGGGPGGPNDGWGGGPGGPNDGRGGGPGGPNDGRGGGPGGPNDGRGGGRGGSNDGRGGGPGGPNDGRGGGGPGGPNNDDPEQRVRDVLIRTMGLTPHYAQNVAKQLLDPHISPEAALKPAGASKRDKAILQDNWKKMKSVGHARGLIREKWKKAKTKSPRDKPPKNVGRSSSRESSRRGGGSGRQSKRGGGGPDGGDAGKKKKKKDKDGRDDSARGRDGGGGRDRDGDGAGGKKKKGGGFKNTFGDEQDGSDDSRRGGGSDGSSPGWGEDRNSDPNDDNPRGRDKKGRDGGRDRPRDNGRDRWRGGRDGDTSDYGDTSDFGGPGGRDGDAGGRNRKGKDSKGSDGGDNKNSGGRKKRSAGGTDDIRSGDSDDFDGRDSDFDPQLHAKYAALSDKPDEDEDDHAPTTSSRSGRSDGRTRGPKKLTRKKRFNKLGELPRVKRLHEIPDGHIGTNELTDLTPGDVCRALQNMGFAKKYANALARQLWDPRIMDGTKALHADGVNAIVAERLGMGSGNETTVGEFRAFAKAWIQAPTAVAAVDASDFVKLGFADYQRGLKKLGFSDAYAKKAAGEFALGAEKGTLPKPTGGTDIAVLREWGLTPDEANIRKLFPVVKSEAAKGLAFAATEKTLTDAGFSQGYAKKLAKQMLNAESPDGTVAATVDYETAKLGATLEGGMAAAAKRKKDLSAEDFENPFGWGGYETGQLKNGFMRARGNRGAEAFACEQSKFDRVPAAEKPGDLKMLERLGFTAGAEMASMRGWMQKRARAKHDKTKFVNDNLYLDTQCMYTLGEAENVLKKLGFSAGFAAKMAAKLYYEGKLPPETASRTSDSDEEDDFVRPTPKDLHLLRQVAAEGDQEAASKWDAFIRKEKLGAIGPRDGDMALLGMMQNQGMLKGENTEFAFGGSEQAQRRVALMRKERTGHVAKDLQTLQTLARQNEKPELVEKMMGFIKKERLLGRSEKTRQERYDDQDLETLQALVFTEPAVADKVEGFLRQHRIGVTGEVGLVADLALLEKMAFEKPEVAVSLEGFLKERKIGVSEKQKQELQELHAEKVGELGAAGDAEMARLRGGFTRTEALKRNAKVKPEQDRLTGELAVLEQVVFENPALADEVQNFVKGWHQKLGITVLDDLTFGEVENALVAHGFSPGFARGNARQLKMKTDENVKQNMDDVEALADLDIDARAGEERDRQLEAILSTSAGGKVQANEVENSKDAVSATLRKVPKNQREIKRMKSRGKVARKSGGKGCACCPCLGGGDDGDESEDDSFVLITDAQGTDYGDDYIKTDIGLAIDPKTGKLMGASEFAKVSTGFTAASKAKKAGGSTTTPAPRDSTAQDFSALGITVGGKDDDEAELADILNGNAAAGKGSGGNSKEAEEKKLLTEALEQEKNEIEMVLVNGGFAKGEAERLARKCVHADNDSSTGIIARKDCEKLDGMGFGGVETAGTLRMFVAARKAAATSPAVDKEYETCLTDALEHTQEIAFIRDPGQIESALTVQGFSPGFAKKAAKNMLEDAAGAAAAAAARGEQVEEEGEITFRPEDLSVEDREAFERAGCANTDLAALQELVESNTDKQVMSSTMMSSYALASVEVAAESALDLGETEKAFVTLGFKPAMAKSLAKKVAGSSGKGGEEAMRKLTNAEKKELIKLGAGPIATQGALKAFMIANHGKKMPKSMKQVGEKILSKAQHPEFQKNINSKMNSIASNGGVDSSFQLLSSMASGTGGAMSGVQSDLR